MARPILTIKTPIHTNLALALVACTKAVNSVQENPAPVATNLGQTFVTAFDRRIRGTDNTRFQVTPRAGRRARSGQRGS